MAAAAQRSRAWFELALNLPLGMVGAVLNLVPYQITGWVTRRFARTPDEPATYMLLTALLAFPAFWLALGVLGALLAGPITGALVCALAPLTGCLALRLHAALRVLRQPKPTRGLVLDRLALGARIREMTGLPAAASIRSAS